MTAARESRARGGRGSGVGVEGRGSGPRRGRRGRDDDDSCYGGGRGPAGVAVGLMMGAGQAAGPDPVRAEEACGAANSGHDFFFFVQVVLVLL